MVNQDQDGSFYCEHHHEKSVSDLIQYYKSTKEPLSASSQARLRRPIERPQWLLNHDSIRLVKKLGEGAFGEDTPSGVVKLVQQCWAKNPDERPDFSKIFKTLRSMKT
ncbi:unnamed protein product [Brugia timori]|uniref:PK_Tyr_Ser-Thr domain-containing protein n=1 Tax=Brugia timori TaxID=42155 RepID=A0A0R3R9G6_9BILA|nr:unnamed protein product [Brugia timori]